MTVSYLVYSLADGRVLRWYTGAVDPAAQVADGEGVVEHSGPDHPGAVAVNLATGAVYPYVPFLAPNLANVRARRAVLLSATDWAVLPDSPLTTDQRTQAATYRQALRDLTKTPAADIVWPAWPYFLGVQP